MCAILDANVIHEVFGSNRSPAGEQFFHWINTGNGRLVVSDKLLEELDTASKGFREWAAQALIAGRMRKSRADQVSEKAEELRQAALCKSNDLHIIALAQISGARLLYSNDRKLQDDFGKKALIDRPRGKVYSASISKDYKRRKLLANRDLCRERR